MNFTDIVRKRATQLIEDGTVACVIGWTAGRFEYQRTPFCANDSEQAALLVCDQHCEHALGKYVLEQKDKGAGWPHHPRMRKPRNQPSHRRQPTQA